jgi:protein SERAC1
VAQKALCVSRNRADAHLQQVEAQTKGISFVGTPHNGSDLAAWASFGVRLIAKIKDANRQIVETLKRDSEMLQDTQDSFGQLLKSRQRHGTQVQIACFYEEKAVTGIGLVSRRAVVFATVICLTEFRLSRWPRHVSLGMNRTESQRTIW